MAPASAFRRELRHEPDWPALEGRHPVFLVDASGLLERRLLHAWIRRRAPEGVPETDWDAIPIPPTRRRSRRVALAPLEEALAAWRSESVCLCL